MSESELAIHRSAPENFNADLTIIKDAIILVKQNLDKHQREAREQCNVALQMLHRLLTQVHAGNHIQPEEHEEAKVIDQVPPIHPENSDLRRDFLELGLDVRSRKAMVRLGVETIGDICRKSVDELLEVKNFGPTSLRKVRSKLAELGLRLRGDEQWFHDANPSYWTHSYAPNEPRRDEDRFHEHTPSRQNLTPIDLLE